jgi:hypothetical protein
VFEAGGVERKLVKRGLRYWNCLGNMSEEMWVYQMLGSLGVIMVIGLVSIRTSWTRNGISVRCNEV